MRYWIIALGVVAVLALAGGYWYGSWESDEVLVKQSADTASESIKVHGDWEVTVSDPVTGEEMVYAFENKLLENGMLTYLLVGDNKIDNKYILLESVKNQINCQEAMGTTLQSNQLYSKHYLEAQSTIEIAPHLPFTLSAFCTVKAIHPHQSGKIVSVSTVFKDSDSCFKSYLPGSQELFDSFLCGIVNASTGGYSAALTKHDLTPYISVSDGQHLAVNVRISFE